MKIHTQVTVTTEVDLMALPYKEWPERGKECAHQIISRYYQTWELLPEADRKQWLVARVEAIVAFEWSGL